MGAYTIKVMQRVLVTGGAGFIGSHLVEALIQSGRDVTIIDNLSTGNVENLANDVARKAKFVEEDIRNYAALNTVMKGIDTVYHLAALPRIGPSIQDPITAHDVNLTGTLNVLEAARQNGVNHVLFSGSSSIFGPGASIPMKEDSPINPTSPYAYQKSAGEGYLALYRKIYGLKTSVLRLFNVFGPRMPQTGSYAIVVGIFMAQKKAGKPFTIKGDGTQRRDFTFVHDIVKGFLAAGKKGADGTFHLGTGVNHSVNELADIIDPGGKREFLPFPIGDYPLTLADISKAKRELGYEPSMDILDWLRSGAQ